MQRIIAYIYRYEKDKSEISDANVEKLVKCGNTGFCRLENYGDRCVINVCFKEVNKICKDCVIYSLREVTAKCSEYVVLGPVAPDKIINGCFCRKIETCDIDGLLIKCMDRQYIVIWKCTEEQLSIRQREDKRDTVKEKNESVHDILKNSEKDYLERAFNRLGKSRMILDGEEYQVVKMRPQELIMLPRRYWRLANNCFVMQGYYGHKHILFFVYSGQYVIGVPGNGTENEKEYAEKCGFKETIKGYEYGKNNKVKTYWLMIL